MGMVTAAQNAVVQLGNIYKALAAQGAPSNMVGATAGVNGSSGLVPAPVAGQQTYVLNGAGIWVAINTANIVGTATNDSAAAGHIGEVVTSNIAVGSAVALTNGSPANITSISLTGGDWDVYGYFSTNPAGTTAITSVLCGISTTSANLGNFPSRLIGTTLATGYQTSLPCATQQISLASTTTVYLVGQANFTVSTCGGFGYITARRAR
jgi:hypothetical protein